MVEKTEIEIFQSEFDGLNNHDKLHFREFLNMVAGAIRMWDNNQTYPVDSHEWLESLHEQPKKRKNIKNILHKEINQNDDNITMDDIYYSLSLSPRITHFSFEQMDPKGDYAYGRRFIIIVKLFRDTTGLCDAIDVRTCFTMTIRMSKETDYNHILTFEESYTLGEGIPHPNKLKTPISIPYFMFTFDNELKKGILQEIRDAEKKIWDEVYREQAEEKAKETEKNNKVNTEVK